MLLRGPTSKTQPPAVEGGSRGEQSGTHEQDKPDEAAASEEHPVRTHASAPDADRLFCRHVLRHVSRRT